MSDSFLLKLDGKAFGQKTREEIAEEIHHGAIGDLRKKVPSHSFCESA